MSAAGYSKFDWKNRSTFCAGRLLPIIRRRKQETSASRSWVELTSLDPTIKLDIRYATVNNFWAPRSTRNHARLLQKPAAGGSATPRTPETKELGYGFVDPRFIPAVVRDEDFLGCNSGRQEDFRR